MIYMISAPMNKIIKIIMYHINHDSLRSIL